MCHISLMGMQVTAFVPISNSDMSTYMFGFYVLTNAEQEYIHV